MAINFNQFSTGTTALATDKLVGFNNTDPNGERQWSVSTIANAVSGIMSPQLSNITNLNTVDSPTVDLNWNASTRTLSADVSSINSFFTGTNQSLVANGYQKLPGGLIIQWGKYVESPSSTTYRNFPWTFPAVVLSCNLTFTSNASYSIVGAFSPGIGVDIISTSQFRFSVNGNYTTPGGSAFMIAIGY